MGPFIGKQRGEERWGVKIMYETFFEEGSGKRAGVSRSGIRPPLSLPLAIPETGVNVQ